MTTPPNPAQKLAVLLAFVAAALSFSVLAYSFMRTGAIQATPLFGGVLMLAARLERLRQDFGSRPAEPAYAAFLIRGYASAATAAMSALMYPKAKANPCRLPVSPSIDGTWSGIIMPS